MSTRLNWDDKVDINNWEEIDTINKFVDTEINELRDGFNSHADDIEDLENNQVDGILRYDTKALLDLETGVSTSRYEVTDDTDALNGQYKWNGTIFEKTVLQTLSDADKTDVIEFDNENIATSQGVMQHTGGSLSNRLAGISNQWSIFGGTSVGSYIPLLSDVTLNDNGHFIEFAVYPKVLASSSGKLFGEDTGATTRIGLAATTGKLNIRSADGTILTSNGFDVNDVAVDTKLVVKLLFEDDVIKVFRDGVEQSTTLTKKELVIDVIGRNTTSYYFNGYITDVSWNSVEGTQASVSPYFLNPLPANKVQLMPTEKGFLTDLQVAELAGKDIVLNIDLEKGSISSSTGKIINGFIDGYWVTPNYIKLDGSKNAKIDVVFPVGYDYKLIQFNSSKLFVEGDGDWVTDANKEISYSTEFVKIRLRKTSLTAPFYEKISGVSIGFKTKLELEDLFEKNERPDDGVLVFQHYVDTGNPNSCDTSSSSLEDAENQMIDTSVLELPTTYSENKEPTRLILWCHGSSQHYTDASTGIGQIDTEYWLKEGYAVLDTDANPFSADKAHGGNPTAIRCYLAAYKWALEHFNLREDGVLLAGLSAGGALTVNLSNNPSLPALACVSISGGLSFSFPNSYNYRDAATREFLTEKYGFTGTAPTFTSTNPMTTAELDYIEDNYDKLAGYVAMWSNVMDLDRDTLFSFNPSYSASSNATEAAYYADKHKVQRVPLKLMSSTDDPLAKFRNIEYMTNMIRNAGGLVEQRSFPSGGHGIYDDFPITQTTRYGEDVDTYVVMVEAVMFFRRYEN